MVVVARLPARRMRTVHAVIHGRDGAYCRADESNVWLRLPEYGAGEWAASICHITAPPWRFFEHPDGSLSILDSIRRHPIPALAMPEWHGWLRPGNVWEVLDS